ncbi:hypothetical protein RND81_02G056600 [Saponaria officinalis]|uniref:F-box domain-containing protein n=1 Tax=Saponaria officinalis TaxID=3572 RepID=A0AAW1MN97_SAPOF
MPTKDRISELPDEIIVRILSFIPTKQVITSTTLLSKRWRFLWYSLPSLLFHYDGNYDRSPWFTDLIATTLMFNNAKTLEKFSVKFEFWYYRLNCHSTVNTWLRYVTMKSVKELDIDLTSSSDKKYCLPPSIFDNDIFEVLRFKGCLFKLFPKAVSWGSLRLLTVIGSESFSRDNVRVILSGSPQIRSMDFIDCFDSNRSRMVDYHYEIIRR